MIVDAVTHLHSLDVQVNPMNVLAGLEPENTNILLQGLAKAAIKAQSSMIDALLYELESDAAENEREDVDVVSGSVAVLFLKMLLRIHQKPWAFIDLLSNMFKHLVIA